MNTVLEQLNSVPGVIGSLVCDREGHVLAHAFPPLFDPALLQEAAQALADGARGLELAAQTVEALDLRYEEVRVLVKSCAPGHLLVLCGRTASAQLLSVSMSLAATKLEKLRAAAAASARPAAPGAGPGDGATARKVAPPASGLEELRRRLGAAAAQPAPAAPGPRKGG